MKKALFFMVLLATVVAPLALAQTASTQIYVQYPRVAILYYRSSITLQPSLADLATAFAGASPVDQGPTTINTFTASLGNLIGDANTPDLPFSTNVLTTIINFYQVRSNYRFQVAVSITDGTLEAGAGGSGQIDMSNVQTRLNGGSWGAFAQVTTPGGLGTVHQGDVRFDLDFANADLNVGSTSATFGDGVIQTVVSFI
jgi:hypothetical protein